MAKVNMIGSDGVGFTTSLKQSRVRLADGSATLAPAVKAGPRAPAKKAVAKKAPAKKAAKKSASYSTRAMKATR